MNASEIKDASTRLEQKWIADGDCRSCGFHGSLEDYDVQDADIEHAMKNCEGWLTLTCLNKNAESHRGVKVYLGW